MSSSWAALIPLALASVAATSMVENRPVSQVGKEREVADLDHRSLAEVVLALERLGDPVLEDAGGGEVGGGAQQEQHDDGDQQLAHQAPPENGGSRASSAPSGTGVAGSRQRSPSTSTLE